MFHEVTKFIDAIFTHAAVTLKASPCDVGTSSACAPSHATTFFLPTGSQRLRHAFTLSLQLGSVADMPACNRDVVGDRPAASSSTKSPAAPSYSSKLGKIDIEVLKGREDNGADPGEPLLACSLVRG